MFPCSCGTEERCVSQTKYHLIWFAMIYVAQGFWNSYELLAPVYLTEHGLSVSKAGLAAGLGQIPAMLKIGMCLISDYYSVFGYHRKPYIVIGMVVCSLSYFMLGLLPNVGENYVFYVLLLMASKFGSTLYDGVVDGFAAEIMPGDKAGTTQGVMNASRGVGLVLGAVLNGYLAQHVGWNVVFFIAGTLVFSNIPFIICVKELQIHERTPFRWSAFSALKDIRVLSLIHYAFWGTIGTALSLLLIPVYLQDELGLEKSLVGILMGCAAIGVILGSAFAGFAIDKWRTKFYYVFICGATCAICAGIGFAATPKSQGLLVVPFLVMGGLSVGTGLASHLSMAMILTDPAISSSFFGICVVIWNFAGLIGQLSGGFVSEALGYRGTFIFSLGMTVIALPALPFIFRKSDQRDTRNRALDLELGDVASIDIEMEADVNGFLDDPTNQSPPGGSRETTMDDTVVDL